jgi:predicted Zn-dependent peptidase
MHARVEEIGVETQRGVVKEERKNRYDNTPYGSLLANIFANVAKGTPYEWTPIGEAQYIDQADIQEFRDFYKKYYVPNNAVLAIVGDIDLAKTKQWVMEYFTDIPRGADIERPQVTLQTGQGERTVEVREPHTPLQMPTRSRYFPRCWLPGKARGCTRIWWMKSGLLLGRNR